LFSIFFWFEMEQPKKTHCLFFVFLNGYDQSRYQKNKKSNVFCFWDFSMQKTKPNMLKSQKKPWVLFMFFDILTDHIHSKTKKPKFFCFVHFKTQK
jgi:hypothetical protein